MRIPHKCQLQLDCVPIAQVELNSGCRHRIIPVLKALQHLYLQTEVLQRILKVIEADILGDADSQQGRKGMRFWEILVLAAVKAGCDITYDQLQDLAENHRNLRAMMQVGEWEDESFRWERIRDNICLLRPETLEKINHLIVGEGHRLEPEAIESVRGDSFVCETNVHYPTESSLILDGLKKIFAKAQDLARVFGYPGWRQSKSLLKKAKQADRKLSRLKKDSKNYQQQLQEGYHKLFCITSLVLPRLQEMLDSTRDCLPTEQDLTAVGKAVDLHHELVYWHAVTAHVVNTAWRRVVEGETVPNRDKLFSLFEPDTELIRRGKAAKPNEFGHQVLVIEDTVGYICHYQVLGRDEGDQDVLISAMTTLQSRMQHRIQRASFDRGFHSEENQKALATLLAHPCLPKPGSVQGPEQERQATIEFRRSRQRHPGIESAIGALQSGNGLGRCRDRSSLGYHRYVGLGILGRNLFVLGKQILQRENPESEAAASRREAA